MGLCEILWNSKAESSPVLTMVISIIVIMILTTNTYCDDNTGDHLLYIQGHFCENHHQSYEYDVCMQGNYFYLIYNRYVKNVYVKTGEIVNDTDRPEYQNIGNENAKICFRDNEWVITYPNSVTFYNNNNPKQGLTPPKKGWMYEYGTFSV